MTLNEIGIWIRTSYDKPRKRGDFDIYIHREHKIMVIPVNLYHLITLECNAKNAQTVMDYLYTHPQTIARVLGWTEKEVKIAFQRLLMHVQGMLNAPRPPTPGTRRR